MDFVLQMINLGLLLILCNISIEKTPSKYGSVLVLHVKACQICLVFHAVNVMRGGAVATVLGNALAFCADSINCCSNS